MATCPTRTAFESPSRAHGRPVPEDGYQGDYVESVAQQVVAGVPGLLHSITDDYFRRIEAVEFAVKNDDGAEPRNLPKADLVLVGISRTSKTPLSTYLAQRGLNVANVPLVLGVDPPDGPGFGVDEPMDKLGEKLVLPPFLESKRAQIEAGLKPL